MINEIRTLWLRTSVLAAKLESESVERQCRIRVTQSICMIAIKRKMLLDKLVNQIAN